MSSAIFLSQKNPKRKTYSSIGSPFEMNFIAGRHPRRGRKSRPRLLTR